MCTLIYQMGISTLSLRLHLKGVKIARNVTKVGVYAVLLKWVPKSTFKFQFWKSRQKCIFSTLVWPSLIKGQNRSKSHSFKFQFQESQEKCISLNLVWPTLIKDQNSTKSHKNRCQCLYLKWVSKSTLKFEFSENGKNAMI